MNKTIATVLILLSLNLITHAHHSRGGFALNRTVELEGVVTEINWRNPHVYVSVEVPQGDLPGEWLLEGHSITGMLGNGWREDSIEVGDRVSAVVNPMRDASRRAGLIDHFTTNAGESFYAFRRPPTGNAPPQPVVRASTDFSGNWAFRRPIGQVLVFTAPDFESMPLNDAGRALAANFDPNDSPSFNCASDGIPGMLMRAYDYRWLRSADRIVIEKEQSSQALTRTIWLDGRSMPADFEPSVIGFSVGHFEEDGNTLVVETTGFSTATWGISRGIDSSAQKQLTERYRLVNGGLRMIVEYTVEDPVYLSEPMTRFGVYDKRADREFVWVDCDIEAARRHLE